MNQIFNYAVEVGAGDASSSFLLKNYNKFNKILLIEPNGLFLKDLDNYILKNGIKADLKNIAISNVNEENLFFNFAYASFLKDKPSFLKLSCEDNAQDYWLPLASNCKCVSFDLIDDGQIDYLVLTSNGSEFDVLSKMISRPKVIKTKYYCHNSKHWLYYNSVTEWMRKNNYNYNIVNTNQHNTYFEIDFIKI